MHATGACPRHDSWPWAGARAVPQTHGDAMAGLQFVSDALRMPFDVMRAQHAHAVHAGLLANSILESRDFERTVDSLEHITLGPFARHV